MTEVTRLLLVGPEPRELQPVVPERLPESTLELRPIDERLIEAHRLYVHGYALPGRDVICVTATPAQLARAIARFQFDALIVAAEARIDTDAIGAPCVLRAGAGYPDPRLRGEDRLAALLALPSTHVTGDAVALAGEVGTVFRCGTCKAAITRPVLEIAARHDPENDDDIDLEGLWSSVRLTEGRVPRLPFPAVLADRVAVVVHPEDAIVERIDENWGVGCCGGYPEDGRANIACSKGHPIGFHYNDCWAPRFCMFDRAAVEPVSRSSVVSTTRRDDRALPFTDDPDELVVMGGPLDDYAAWLRGCGEALHAERLLAEPDDRWEIDERLGSQRHY